MADTKISDLTEASTLDGTELLLLSQGAADRQQDLATVRDEIYWERPSDWPAMPTTASQTIHMLAAVHDAPGQLARVGISVSSGTWSIDWGDGTTQTGIASGTDAEHEYDFSDVDLPAATTRGYKVAVVTLTTSGGNITAFRTSVPPTGTTAHTPPWLEWQINASAITSLGALSNQCIPRLLEYINFVAVGSVTTFSVSNCTRLTKLTYPTALISGITNWANMFVNCANLRRLDLSGMAAGVTTLSSAFSGCAALRELTFPSGTLGSVTDLTSAFSGCSSLRSITLPSGAFAGVTSAPSAFGNCLSLRSIVFPSGAFVSTTNLSAMFSGCNTLLYCEFGSGLAAATNIATMFNGCTSLQHIKFASGGFSSLSSATTNLFGGCSALARIQNCEIPLTFTIANCRNGATELDEIYTALPTITSQTITVTGNRGTSGDDPTIATGKGWTVTG